MKGFKVPVLVNKGGKIVERTYRINANTQAHAERLAVRECPQGIVVDKSVPVDGRALAFCIATALG